MNARTPVLAGWWPLLSWFHLCMSAAAWIIVILLVDPDGDNAGAAMAAIVAGVLTAFSFPQPLRLVLGDDTVVVRTVFWKRQFFLSDVTSIRWLTLREAPLVWTFWPQIAIVFGASRVRVPRGPLGQARFLGEVLHQRPGIEIDDPGFRGRLVD